MPIHMDRQLQSISAPKMMMLQLRGGYGSATYATLHKKLRTKSECWHAVFADVFLYGTPSVCDECNGDNLDCFFLITAHTKGSHCRYVKKKAEYLWRVVVHDKV